MIHERKCVSPFIYFNNLMGFKGGNVWNDWKLQNIRFREEEKKKNLKAASSHL